MNKILRLSAVLLLVVAISCTTAGLAMYRERQARDATSTAVATQAEADAAKTLEQFSAPRPPGRAQLAGEPEKPVKVPKLNIGQKMAVLDLPHVADPILIKQGTNNLNRETELLNTGAAVHYVDSATWFDRGVFAMSGHRTTYGAVFNKLDKMHAGDVATVTTRDGTYRYRYYATKIITPDEVWVIKPLTKKRYQALSNGGLVMTACHPKHSARQRIVVFWTLTGYVTR